MAEEKVTSLAPILPTNPKVLILGSMPSEISLEKQAYYGNPRNHFWDILFTIFNQIKIGGYQEKINFVKQHNIALWDAIGMCYRKGSLDSTIVEEEPNDIARLLQKYPTIKLIACNGTKSYKTFNKYITLTNPDDVEVIKMPSTSPIPGRYNKNFEEKVEDWKLILDYL